MTLIDEALSANATIASDYDPASTTSAPGGSAKCSRTSRPSLASKGGAASRVLPPGVVLIGMSVLILAL
jgi:hypothetical protein